MIHSGMGRIWQVMDNNDEYPVVYCAECGTELSDFDRQELENICSQCYDEEMRCKYEERTHPDA